MDSGDEDQIKSMNSDLDNNNKMSSSGMITQGDFRFKGHQCK